MPEESAGPPEGVTRRGRRERLAALCTAGVAVYLALSASPAATGADLPDAVKVGVPFLLLPALVLWWTGSPAEWGRPDRAFLLSAACYAPFALWVAASVPGAPPKYFAGLPALAFSVPGGLLWAASTFVHVGAVDYFTKRVVQRESEILWGARRAQVLQFAAWGAGHVVEWFWLREVLGDGPAGVFLLSAGAVTGWAFARWRSVAGLMAGHLMVNVVAALAALAVYG